MLQILDFKTIEGTECREDTGFAMLLEIAEETKQLDEVIKLCKAHMKLR
jgi:hypothetical protein